MQHVVVLTEAEDVGIDGVHVSSCTRFLHAVLASGRGAGSCSGVAESVPLKVCPGGVQMTNSPALLRLSTIFMKFSRQSPTEGSKKERILLQSARHGQSDTGTGVIIIPSFPQLASDPSSNQKKI